MRPDHFLCILIVPCLQALLFLTAAANPPGSVTTTPFTILALVVPFGCYVWGLREASFNLKTSRRAVRFAVRIVVAIGLTLGGFLLGLDALVSHGPL